MAFAETAPLIAALKLDDKFSGPLKNAGKALGSFDAKLDHTQSRAFRAGQQIGTGIKNTARIAAVGVGILVSQVALGLNSLIKLEQAQAQTAAVLKSTGGVAGQTGESITKLSNKYEALNATVGDEFVRAGANMLLTFTNIRSKAFEPALAATLDLNTALGKGPEGLTGTAILVGKALNDPVRGLTALRRVGVSFTAEQEKQIKTLVKQNDLYGAQKIIVGELNREYQGSFIAQGNTTAGKVAKFTDSIEDLQRALAEALLPTLGNVADALTKTLADPAVVEGVRSFGKSLADLISPANLAGAGAILQSVFNTAREAAPGIAAAAQIMGQVVGTAVGVFRTLPKEIQQLAIGAFAVNKLTGGLVTNIAGGILGGIAKGGLFSRGSSPANPLFVSDVAGGLGGGPLGPLTKGEGLLGLLIKGVFPATVILTIGTQIGQAIVDQLGGPTADTNGAGRDLGNGITLGKNEAALVRAASALEDIAGRLSPAAGADRQDHRNLPKIGPIPGPKFAGDPRALAVIASRGEKAGFHPTDKAILATFARNQERLAAVGAKAAEKSAEAAGASRDAVIAARQNPIVVPAPNTSVKVTVNVTAAQVSKSIVIQKRFGPPGGSRESDAGHYGGAGP